MKLLSIFLLLTLNFLQTLSALSSSVAIPCYYKHFPYLDGLLDSLTLQTLQPDEVVISLSEVEKIDSKDIDTLENKKWPFNVKIIRRSGVHMEGSNRTKAAINCKSDIIFCIDADDIPHPQRIEAVIKIFKKKPDAVMVLCGHAYCPGESIVCDSSIPFYSQDLFLSSRFDLESSQWLKLKSIEELTHWDTGIHNGSPSIRKKILDDLSWSDLKNGADLEFNEKVFLKYNSTFLIKLPLLHYYNGRSSGLYIGR